MHLVLRETAAPILALFAAGFAIASCLFPFLATALSGDLAINGEGVGRGATLLRPTPEKAAAFFGAGISLVIAGLAKWQVRSIAWPADAQAATTQARIRVAGDLILGIAAATYVVGALFAFFASDAQF
ncbi:MAG: hypothetical protein AAFX08_10525 [Pseudomonadota bacterium]